MLSWLQLPGIATIARVINKQLQLKNEYLQIENRILKEQLGNKRIQFTDQQRITLAKAAKPLKRSELKEIATIAKPETMVLSRKFRKLKKRGFESPRL